MASKAKPFLPLVAGKSYLTASGQVVCLEQSTDRTLVYVRSTRPVRYNTYWVKKTGRLFRNQDSPLGNIIGLANDPPSLEGMLKACLE
jgi:hypothetical protein